MKCWSFWYHPFFVRACLQPRFGVRGGTVRTLLHCRVWGSLWFCLLGELCQELSQDSCEEVVSVIVCVCVCACVHACVCLCVSLWQVGIQAVCHMTFYRPMGSILPKTSCDVLRSVNRLTLGFSRTVSHLFLFFMVSLKWGTTDAETKGSPWWEFRAIKGSLFLNL